MQKIPFDTGLLVFSSKTEVFAFLRTRVIFNIFYIKIGKY